MPILFVFFALQLFDLVTTLVFLHHGVREANPLVALLILISARPAFAVVMLKLAACALALFAWRTHRFRLLRRANLFFLVCVAWNLVAIVVA